MDDFTWYGAPDSDGISPWHKIWIIQWSDNNVGVGVAGYLGEGTSKEIVSNWDAPFADSSLESRFRIAGGLVQLGALDSGTKGMTSLTQLNSRQVWVGNQPYTFNLVLKLRAFTDAQNEVEKAIEALDMMMAPDLQAGAASFSGVVMPSLNSRVPKPVSINFGRKQIWQDCCIRSMSVPHDKEKDPNGNLIRADVSLQVETLQSVTVTDLKTMYSDNAITQQ